MFPAKRTLTIETFSLRKDSEKERERARREREREWEAKRETGEKTPDASDFTSQPVKEESERAVKPSLPAAACKVEILPFTFGQMQGSHCGVCACVCLCARSGPLILRCPETENVHCCLILRSHIFFPPFFPPAVRHMCDFSTDSKTFSPTPSKAYRSLWGCGWGRPWVWLFIGNKRQMHRFFVQYYLGAYLERRGAVVLLSYSVCELWKGFLNELLAGKQNKLQETSNHIGCNTLGWENRTTVTS